jgi:hypothetical protein
VDYIESSSDQLMEQALIALMESDGASPLRNLFPIFNHVIIYSSAVLPGLNARDIGKHREELDSKALLQTVATATNVTRVFTNDDDVTHLVESMLALGKVMGRANGFNPVQIVMNAIGTEKTRAISRDMMDFATKFPGFSNQRQILAAQQVSGANVLAVNLIAPYSIGVCARIYTLYIYIYIFPNTEIYSTKQKILWCFRLVRLR